MRWWEPCTILRTLIYKYHAACSTEPLNHSESTCRCKPHQEPPGERVRAWVFIVLRTLVYAFKGLFSTVGFLLFHSKQILFAIMISMWTFFHIEIKRSFSQGTVANAQLRSQVLAKVLWDFVGCDAKSQCVQSPVMLSHAIGLQHKRLYMLIWKKGGKIEVALKIPPKIC